MTDRVEFTAPFGPAGRLVEKLILRQYLERLIRDRGNFLASASPPNRGTLTRKRRGSSQCGAQSPAMCPTAAPPSARPAL